jgi:poly-gamma-glutamate synthesis protein (capsule biosynthesis protein)
VLDPDYPHLSYGSDAKRSLVAKAIIGQKGIEKVSFLPVLIDKKLRPEVLCNGDARFQEAVQFMEWVSEDFDHQFKVDGDEVLITSRK